MLQVPVPPSEPTKILVHLTSKRGDAWLVPTLKKLEFEVGTLKGQSEGQVKKIQDFKRLGEELVRKLKQSESELY